MLLNFNANQLRRYPEQTLTSTRTSSDVGTLRGRNQHCESKQKGARKRDTKLDFNILNPSLWSIGSISHQALGAEPAKETATLHSLNQL